MPLPRCACVRPCTLWFGESVRCIIVATDLGLKAC